MYRKIAALLPLLLLSLPSPALAATPPPNEAIEAMVESVRLWDVETISVQVEGDAGDELFSYLAATRPLLSYLDCEAGNYRIDGNKAVVDAAVTAADVRPVMAQLAVEAAVYAALRDTGYITDNGSEILLSHIEETVGQLTTIRTNTTAYLTLGGDGNWKLDTADPRNMAFLSALTGGLLDAMQQAQ